MDKVDARVQAIYYLMLGKAELFLVPDTNPGPTIGVTGIHRMNPALPLYFKTFGIGDVDKSKTELVQKIMDTF